MSIRTKETLMRFSPKFFDFLWKPKSKSATWTVDVVEFVTHGKPLQRLAELAVRIHTQGIGQLDRLRGGDARHRKGQSDRMIQILLSRI